MSDNSELSKATEGTLLDDAEGRCVLVDVQFATAVVYACHYRGEAEATLEDDEEPFDDVSKRF
ncbi:MAG: hypothetical protein ABJA94_10390 [Rhodoglobus sp.]